MNPAHPIAAARTRRRDRTGFQRPATSWYRASHYATIALVGCFVLFLLILIALSAYGAARAGEAYSGVSVAGIDVSGKSRDEIRAIVDSAVHEYESRPIALVAGDQQFPTTLADAGVAIDVEATVERAMGYGREGSWWDRSIAWTRAYFGEHDVDPVVTVNAATYNAYIASLAPQVEADPQDAYIDFSGEGKPQLVADVPGLRIDADITRAKLVDTVTEMTTAPVSMAIVSVPAAVNVSAIEGGLPDAERAVSTAVMLSSEEGQWPIEPEQLKALVWVDDQGQLNVREDEARAVVEATAAEIDRSAQDAGITVDANGQFVIVPAVHAAEVDIDASTDALVAALTSGGTDVGLVVNRSAPKITDDIATEWAGKADALAGDGVLVSWGDDSATITRAELIWAMVITPQPDNANEPFKLTFDQAILQEQLTPIAEAVYQAPQDVSLRLVNGEVKTEEEAKEGREVDLEASAKAVNDAALDGTFKAALEIDRIDPEYTSDDAEDLTFDDLLGDSTTYYGDSSDPRRQNVERAVELEGGWIIPPGGIFSYAEVMGLVTPENGFVTGYGIVADPNGGVTTAPVVGGGICQVSTTIFQAAWWAGLEIVERYQHPYWLLAYGEPPRGMMGLDAMVNIEPDWALDLKFRNSTDDWIVLETWADGVTVGAEIRGVDQGWTVETADPVFSNIVKADPKMVFTETTELPAGEKKQVEYAKDGFDSSIKRTVRDRNGNLVSEYTLESSYAASRNMTLVGVGTGNGEANG